MIRDDDMVIGDDTLQSHMSPVIDGQPARRGLVPRDYSAVPQGFYKAAPPFNFPLIPRNEWAEMIREGEAKQSFLSHIRRRSGPNGGLIPSLDQNGQGFCWAYSAVACVMLWRAVMNLPYVRLSAHMVGCLVKNYRDEGGWCGLSCDFIDQHGVPSVEFWPEKSMRRQNDTPAMRENAQLHNIDGAWADLSAAVYDRNMTADQQFTLLLSRIPVQGDRNRWAHSTCDMDPVMNLRGGETAKLKKIMATDFGSLDLNNEKDAAVFADTFGVRGWNSWTDSYGNMGEFVMMGSLARIDGGVAPGVPGASIA